MKGSRFGFLTPETLPLFTDLYELTMMQGYVETDHLPRATFDLYFRKLPPDRGYVVAAGLEQVVAYVESLSFAPEAVEYLAELDFHPEFLDYLESFSFSGDVRAVPEGTVVFPNEPLLTVTAPLPEAQLIETLVVNQVGFQSLVATKAARMRDVVTRRGDDQSLVDFGSRRAHGTDAGLKAARAAYVGGFDGTSNVAAGEAFDVPVFGTMAHSWVQSFPTERDAFEAFVEVYGEDAVLLVDTYDTVGGTRTAIAVAEDAGHSIAGVRLDSGDLVALSKEVADLLDSADLGDDVGVVVSSGLDEYAIDDFLAAGGVATGFGPGTALVTSEDAPSLDAVYKLVAVERDGELRPTMKLSSGKVPLPGPKRVWRVADDDSFRRDVVGRADEDLDGEELLVDVCVDGSTTYSIPDLDASRERTLDQLDRLPADVRHIRDPGGYPVETSDALQRTATRLRSELESRYLAGG